MKGQILHIDPHTGDGVITGADGVRYGFAAHDLRGSGQIATPGVAVDFEVSGQRAIEIYPAPGTLRNAYAGGGKSKVIAGVLALLLGALGAHKFYLGATGAGIIMLLASLFGWVLLFIPNWIVGVIAVVEGIIYLTRTDDEFHERYEIGKRPWF